MKKNIFERFGVGLALLLELVLFGVLSPFFLTPENLLNVSLQISITAIIAAGMTMVILTGGIDLSVGSVVALAGVLSTSVLKMSPNITLGFAFAIVVGLAVGMANGSVAGLFITRFRVPPFIVTLALMTVLRGLAFVYTEGRPVWELPEAFALVGAGRLLGIPIPTIIMVLVFGVVHVALTRTRFGRYVYAVGGNAEAARLAGINTRRILNIVYVVSGGLAALSGILMASRMNSGQPNAGMMYELDVIAAVVVGGTSLTGGRGTVIGTLIGSMLIGVLRNGLNLLDVGSYVQQVIVGAVILGAVLLDRMRKV
jgi:ribose/xylose/arabinose/galactoside ABC-type transport system permease subunit